MFGLTPGDLIVLLLVGAFLACPLYSIGKAMVRH
jgi:hypothetical protein